MIRLGVGLIFVLSLGALLASCITPQPNAETVGTLGSSNTRRSEFLFDVELYSANIPASEEADKHYTRYSRVITKRDIVWVGEHVEIDQIERTNGGDILIFADTVTINAPLDTRVYVDHSGWDVEPTSSSNCVRSDSLGPAAYLDFYQQSNDVWDPAQRAFVRGRAAAYPELPHGFTPCAMPGRGTYIAGSLSNRGWSPIRGQHFASGNITIFANRIEFCPGCLRNDSSWNGDKPERPECGPAGQDRPDYTFLNARGARGSRGFAGGHACSLLSACRALNETQMSDGFRRGASNGGDAGDIRIFFVNNEAAANAENDVSIPPANRLFPGRTGVSGGQAGASTSYRAPCSASTVGGFPRCDPMPAAPRCWFRETTGQSSQNPPGVPSAGQSGSFAVNSLNSSEALVELSDALRTLELSRSYSLEDPLRQLESGRFTSRLTPSGVLEDYLRGAVRDAITEQTQRSRRLDPAPSGTPPLPRILRELSSDTDAYLGMSDDQSRLAILLSRFGHEDVAGFPTGSLRGYLMRTGGLLALRRDDPKGDIQFRVIAGRLIEIQREVGRLALEVKRFRYDFYGYVRAQEEAAYRRRIQDLRTALEDAEAKLRDQSNPLSQIQKVVTKVASITKSVQDSYAAFSAHDYEGGLKPLGSIAGDIRDITKILRGENIDPAAIRDLVLETERAYQAFADETRAVQNRMIQDQQAQVATLVSLQSDASRLMLYDFELFDDLYKAIILTRLRTTDSSGQQNYERDLAELRRLFDYSGLVPTFAIPSYPITCTSGLPIAQVPSQPTNPDCVQTQMGLPQPAMLRVRTIAGNELSELPLIFIAARSSNAPQIRMFGSVPGTLTTYQTGLPPYP